MPTRVLEDGRDVLALYLLERRHGIGWAATVRRRQPPARNVPRVNRRPRPAERGTRDALAHLEPLREELFEEIVGRVQETDASAPTRLAPYEYFVRTLAGQQYAVHCRRDR